LPEGIASRTKPSCTTGSSGQDLTTTAYPACSAKLCSCNGSPGGSGWIRTATKLGPNRWLYFNYAHQILQAALADQGGALVEVFPVQRMDTPYAYFLLEGRRSGVRADVQFFRAWLLAQAKVTRGKIEGK
jgi:hypothetical protein